MEPQQSRQPQHIKYNKCLLKKQKTKLKQHNRFYQSVTRRVEDQAHHDELPR